MTNAFDPDRRKFFGTATLLIGGALVPASALAEEKKEGAAGEEVTPPEDLMREHGVLDRLLLVYEAGLRKFADRADFDPAFLVDSANIVRTFIEDYHEKSEEEAVFPRFKQAGKLPGLVDSLLKQHQAGRRVTDVILRNAPKSRKDEDARWRTIGAIQAFIVMYRPHAAREDTVLFPMLRQLVSAHEYDAMAEDFEQKEHRLFGEDGFEKMVERVAGIEKSTGVYDLDQFTPKT